MEDHTALIQGYLQVRRVLVAIAFANGDIDDQERMVIASSIGGAAHLGADHIKQLIDDVTAKPEVGNLVADITGVEFLRQLVIDLTVLATVKAEWHPNELAAVYQAIDAMQVEAEARQQLRNAFDLLCRVSQSIGAEP